MLAGWSETRAIATLAPSTREYPIGTANQVGLVELPRFVRMLAIRRDYAVRVVAYLCSRDWTPDRDTFIAKRIVYRDIDTP